MGFYDLAKIIEIQSVILKYKASITMFYNITNIELFICTIGYHDKIYCCCWHLKYLLKLLSPDSA